LSATSSIKVVVIAGPTASGKSALALDLAEAFNGTLINADSQQRYRDLPILTARPTEAERARAPHSLFGDMGPMESGTAGEWALKAAAEIRDVAAAGRLPIVVGGTGLYLRALMDGLAEIPDVSPDVRATARARLEEIGNAAFHAELAVRDPVIATRLAPGDSQRMLRAWEVVEATGTPLSAWQQEATRPPIAAHFARILLLPTRPVLNEACDARLESMAAHGALQEVKALLESGIPRTAPVMRALGAAEFAAYAAGEIDRAGAMAGAKLSTRRYVKSQITWFKRQFNAKLTFETQFSERFKDEIFSKIRHLGLTG
jgi:tRNA dimethylallyltransferase